MELRKRIASIAIANLLLFAGLGINFVRQNLSPIFLIDSNYSLRLLL